VKKGRRVNICSFPLIVNFIQRNSVNKYSNRNSINILLTELLNSQKSYFVLFFKKIIFNSFMNVACELFVCKTS